MKVGTAKVKTGVKLAGKMSNGRLNKSSRVARHFSRESKRQSETALLRGSKGLQPPDKEKIFKNSNHVLGQRINVEISDKIHAFVGSEAKDSDFLEGFVSNNMA